MRDDAVRRATAAHAGWIFLSTASWFGALLSGTFVLLFDERWNWSRVVVVSVAYGAGMALVETWQTRGPGGLDRQREQLLRDRRFVPALLGLTAVVVAAAAATTDAASSDATARGLWSYAGAAGVAAVAAPVWVRRRLRVVEDLRRTSGERPGA